MASKQKARNVRRFRFRTKLSAADAAKIASDLATGLKAGQIPLSAEEQSVVLAPGGDMCLRIRARERQCKKGTRGKLRIDIRYMKRAAS